MRAAFFTPAVISSLFEARLTSEDGSPIRDPLLVGARGGGFALRAGLRTSASVEPARGGGSVEVLVDGRREEARTTRAAVSILMGRLGISADGLRIRISHRLAVPTGSGFGTSASGAMGAVLALSAALGRPLPIVEASRIAHAADVISSTGLGTAEGLIAGGVGLVTEPGALWFGRFERIPFSGSLAVVALHFGPVEKSRILGSPDALERANRAGAEAMRRVVADPRVETLLREARRFAESSGVGDGELLSIADDLVAAGALGATQNMIGRAVHAVVHRRRLPEVLRAASEYGARVIVSGIHDGGPRPLGAG
ncbi:MAG: hypothetical protein ACP5ID_04030 [Conexivisphaera sp.]